MANLPRAVQPFPRLLEIMQTLLSPEGCPWDREQTHASLKRYLLEETYECLDAIDSGDPSHLKEELGDLLLQVVFHAALAEKSRTFAMDDLIAELNEKLIRRHPHVFGDASINNAEAVIDTWEQIKSKEKGKSERSSLLDGVPRALPALARAHKLSGKAAKKAGFDWQRVSEVWDKLHEELDELKTEERALETAPPSERETHLARLESELGDVLFAAANLARHHGIDPEEALQKTNARFISRFQWMEGSSSVPLNDLSLEEKEALWISAKRSLAAL